MPQPGGYIGFDRVPSTTAASGIWSVRDAGRFKRGGSWPSAIPQDPNFASVSLLLHMDGSGTSFSDSSANNLTVTANGDATQSDTESKFGGKSAVLAGGSDSLTVPAGSLFAYGTGDFTIEAWIYRTSTSGPTTVFAQTESGTNYVLFGVDSDGTVFFIGTDSGGGDQINGPSGTLVVGDTWHHVAVVRSSGDVTVYCDGVGGTATANTTDFANTTRVPTVGRYTHTGTNAFIGYIDELRVTKGVARYTSTFTPPTTPFANE